MICGRGPAAASRSIATCAGYEDGSSIWIFQLAIVTDVALPPDDDEPEPEDDEPLDEEELPAVTLTHSTLNPEESNISVITCCPAPSVTLVEIVVQFCHPPVA